MNTTSEDSVRTIEDITMDQSDDLQAAMDSSPSSLESFVTQTEVTSIMANCPDDVDNEQSISNVAILSDRRNSRPPCLQPPKLRRSSARDVILDAVEFLERENTHLRTTNMDLVKEIAEVRGENNRLREGLSEYSAQVKTLEKEQIALRERMSKQSAMYEEKTRERERIREHLQAESTKALKQLENARFNLLAKDSELRRMQQEMENMASKVEAAAKSSMQERKMELLHQVEQLKDDRRDLTGQKETLQRLNERAQEELKKVESKLEQQNTELKNENRRHSLLTKEFNSLLEENNRLKRQMRRRSLGQNAVGARNTNTDTPDGESAGDTLVRDSLTSKEIVPRTRLDFTPKLPTGANAKRISVLVEARRSHTCIVDKTLMDGFPALNTSRSISKWQQC